jgi:hypothetical protein
MQGDKDCYGNRIYSHDSIGNLPNETYAGKLTYFGHELFEVYMSF